MEVNKIHLMGLSIEIYIEVNLNGLGTPLLARGAFRSPYSVPNLNADKIHWYLFPFFYKPELLMIRII